MKIFALDSSNLYVENVNNFFELLNEKKIKVVDMKEKAVMIINLINTPVFLGDI